MINIKQVRPLITANSSSKVKEYSGVCSLTKQLKNGYGAIIKPKNTIFLTYHKCVKNIRIVSSSSPILSLDPNKKVELQNIFLIGNGRGTAMEIRS